MTKEEIYEKVCGWIADGKLVSRSAVSAEHGYWYDIWKLVSAGELFFTSYERIVATDMAVRDEFQRMLDEHRVMSALEVTIRHTECRSEAAVEKLVDAGKLLRVKELPRIKLYIE